MRVLITGAAGFIGRHLVADQLQRGRTVTAVDLDTTSLTSLNSHSRLCLIQGDFADRRLIDPHLANQDICFHLAAAHLESSLSDEHFWRVNVTDTLDFAIRCHLAGVARFIHCSTVGVYGPLRNLPADEESPCQPDIVYEKSKLTGEQKVLTYARETGFIAVIVRPSWVYGPGCPRTARLFRTIQKKRFFFVGDGQTLRHPIYIADMVRGFELAATTKLAPGELFIIGGPEPVTLQALTTEIAGSMNVSAPRLRLPYTIAWMGCVLLEGIEKVTGRETPFSRRSLKFFTDNTAFDTRKARELLDFTAETSLSAGLAQTRDWLAGDQKLV